MNYTEEPIRFSCAGDTLLGIVAAPRAAAETGVVVIVGGPQYRVGSHRQFVRLSRALAAAGYAVLRFDCRGMGDSEGRQRDFETVDADIAAAIDAFHAHIPGLRQIVLWGLCDGASAALLYCGQSQDARVRGLCLLNPWARGESSLARTHLKHYYARRLTQLEFWSKLIRGEIGWERLAGLARNARTAWSAPDSPSPLGKPPFQSRMARAWMEFKHPILLLLSGHDYTAKEFLECVQTRVDWKGALDQPLVQRWDLPEADHTFSSARWEHQVETRVLEWLDRRDAAPCANIEEASARSGVTRLRFWKHPELSAPKSFLALALCLWAGAAWSQVSTEASSACGPLRTPGQYGPYDYRTDRDKLAIVLGAHFTPEVEALIRGRTGVRPGGDIDYTLRAIPNHHRALIAMMRLGEKEKTPQPSGSRYSIECWFERAVLFRPDDAIVRMIYSSYLNGAGKTTQANAQLDIATVHAKDNALTHNNIGLHYFDLKNYDKALAQAHKALSLGMPKTALQDMLSRVGRWTPPADSAATPGAGPASAEQAR
jgi:exosortase A-associated hydrolase 1